MEHLILKRIFVLFNNNRNGREIMGMLVCGISGLQRSQGIKKKKTGEPVSQDALGASN